jgi:signal transduction histidine kinase
MASNGDGVWNGEEAALSFTIAPALWETPWFRASLVLIAAATFAAVYRIRGIQVARTLHMRFEERLAERARVAQDLHDTLLQGFVSASMHLHVATDKVSEDSPAKPLLNRVLDLMTRVIAEGRNAVQGLRPSPAGSQDLAEAFSQMSAELSLDGKVEYRVVVEGRDRPLNPIIRDEVYRIGREAVVNACRHAGAARIEIEIEYGSTELRMLVRDDGRGIDPHVVQSGRDGHWGLAGMRERAERIGARFALWSNMGAGTEVDLTVPARVAFAREEKS